MNKKTVPFFLALAALALGAWFFLRVGGEMAAKTADKASVEDPTPPESEKPGSTDAPKAPPAPIDPATVATVRGVVRFDGPDSERRPQNMSGFADCKALNPEPALEESLMVKGGKVQNAIVFVRKGLEGRDFPAPDGENPVMDQINCIYTPHVLTMRAGQTLSIVNSDPLPHNVHSNSTRNRDFNEPMNTKGSRLEKKLDKAEFFYLRCDIHSWMRGHVGVFAHPFYHLTGEDGAFELEGLPPGKYTLRVWHELLDPVDKEIELGAKEKKTLDFLLKKK